MRMNIESLAIQGRESRSMAESVSMRIRDLRKKAIQDSFKDFRESGHRMEMVSKVRGVEYVDDAKASNVNASWFALESMTRPVIWIVGGVTTGCDFVSMRNLVEAKVKSIVCLGQNNEAIKSAFSDLVPVMESFNMHDAVQTAYLLAEEGQVVLLSPACPSFDLFESYQDKGEQFRKYVSEL